MVQSIQVGYWGEFSLVSKQHCRSDWHFEDLSHTFTPTGLLTATQCIIIDYGYGQDKKNNMNHDVDRYGWKEGV